ncbi:hypothetical protein LR48_Vigan02g155900 [Vigna angularis]|uniref:Uncharacterized protein n=1 Tax=Phaseolus angularis TaxID=3914 RepID=A0A0L9TZ11_PHAAN|nr:hypothetical protein LR48_Vigan02g155900 [Vigna angularis]
MTLSFSRCGKRRSEKLSVSAHHALQQHRGQTSHGLCTVEPSPFFGSSSDRIRFTGTIPTLLRHNVLARAEDKARDPTSSSFQTQQSPQSQVQASFLYD